MNDLETARFDMFGRVETSGHDCVTDFAARSKAVTHFADDFPAPTTSSQSALLTTTDAYLVELVKAGVASESIANELSADFVQDLIDGCAAIDAPKEAVRRQRRRGQHRRRGLPHPGGYEEVNYLNTLMHDKYSRHGDKLRAWKSASHIEHASQREKKPAVRAASHRNHRN